jgi:endosialidase-like protein
MSDGGGSTQPSAEERALTAEQTALIREQRDLLRNQLEAQNMLSPLILDQLGIEKVFSDVANPRLAQIDSEISKLQSQLSSISPGPMGSGLRNQIQQKLDALTTERSNAAATIQKQTGFAKRPPTAEELQQEQIQKRFQDLTLAELESQAAGAPQRSEIENLTRERTLKALKGELEVDPTLTHELEVQEQNLRSNLMKQLGPGYETSTPGIQALAEFNRRKGELIYGANRGEITLGEQLAGAREAAGYQRSSGFMPQTELRDRLRTSQLNQVFGYGIPGRGIDYSGTIAAFQGPLNQMFQERQLNAQRSAQGTSDWFNLLGTAAGFAALKFSDRRVKEDIKKVGKTKSGLPVYTFKYKGDPIPQMGVMAQDVEKKRPDLVKEIFGVKAVNYEGIS